MTIHCLLQSCDNAELLRATPASSQTLCCRKDQAVLHYPDALTDQEKETIKAMDLETLKEHIRVKVNVSANPRSTGCEGYVPEITTRPSVFCAG